MISNVSALCRAVALGGALLSLTACSMLQSEQDPAVEYQSAEAGRRLEVPPDLIRPEADRQFDIPDAAAAAAQPIRRSTILPRPEGVRFERVGAQSWLEFDLPPAALWPRLQAFWKNYEYELERDEPLLGLQETVWTERRPIVPQTGLAWLLGKMLSDRYSGSLMDKYRFRVERAVDEQGQVGSRLFVTHWGLREELAGPDRPSDVVETAWLWAGSDPALEAEMTRQLMLYLGVEAQQAAGLLSEADVRRLTQRAYLEQSPQGQWSLVLNQTFDLSWLQMADALEAVGLAVDESDRDQGLFEVGYIGPAPGADAAVDRSTAESEGLFSRIFSTTDVERSFTVRLEREPGLTRVFLSELDAPSEGESLTQVFYQRLLEQFK